MNSNFKGRLLVVDDDSLIHDSIKMLLPKAWEMISAKSALEIPEVGQVHAAFVDMHLTKNLKIAEGPEIVAKIRERFPLAEIYAMSGDLTIELMEESLDQGARRFLAKPLHPEEVISSLEKIEALWALRHSELRHRVASNDQITGWIGKSEASDHIRYQISILKGEAGPVLIEGETGTGKEVTARLLNHQELARPFIAVNLGAIPENLFESEFFGHVRGAFTGADSLKVGLAEAANGGDLFLDEIEALPLSQQAKLLRFLESGEVRKVGAKDIIHVKVRIIAASNRPLQEMVKEGSFREDLLFRLKSHCLQLPPLRHRPDDIEDMVGHFLRKQKRAGHKVFSPEAIIALKAYAWPGNVRELKRIVEQLSLRSPLPIIREVDVRKILSADEDPQNDEANDSGAMNLALGLTALVENFEKKALVLALERSANDVDRAAELLQISRSNFYKKLKDYGIGLER